MMSESIKDKQYTLVRNPNYYRASEGLPYLDKIIFRVIANNTLLSDLKAGTVISSWALDIDQIDTYNKIASYKVVTNPTSSTFEMMIFNFKNAILGKDPAVRKAIAMAIDHNALIKNARHGLGLELCTDHGSAYNLGYQANAPCPKLDPAAANQLLDQDGWTKGGDGVRTKGGQRLEFSYSTVTNQGWHQADETIIQQNLNAIGVKINIQNYTAADFFGTVLTNGKFDLAEYSNTLSYDPDDSILAGCNQTEPNGGSNFASYCNPSLDQLFTQERSTIDPAARQQIFNQIHQIYLTDFPFIVLYSPQDASIAKSTVHNYMPGPSYGAAETINIWEWWCDNGKC